MLECTLLPATDRQPATLRVSGEAGIVYIHQFKTALVEALRDHPDLTVDCQGVTNADFSCLQLLWSARHSFPGMHVTPASREALSPVILAAGLDRIQGCCMEADQTNCLWICPDPPSENNGETVSSV